MQKRIIEKTISINAPVNIAWRAFTDPALTKKMGGEYVSGWKPGSSIGWKGPNGKLYTHGIILEIEKEKMIKHSLLDMDDNSKLLSVITYRFSQNAVDTVLSATEELNYEMTDEELEEASDGWDHA